MKYILYNPKANNGILPSYLEGVEYQDATKTDYATFFSGLAPEDEVTLVGGDGTVNFLVNAVDPATIRNNIYLRQSGTGNDFLNDLDIHDDREVLLNDYLGNLPTVYVNGMERRFINGIGYGIDGYCCEVADGMREAGYTGAINYAGIAIKGLLFHFKQRNATITIDGREYSFKKVWLAPTMKGRFYGGGMKIAPEQSRKNETVSVVVYHTWSKLKALIVFPNIFKGTHVSHNEMVSVMTGREVTVRFDRPCALQIDGDTVLNVSEYTVKA